MKHIILRTITIILFSLIAVTNSYGQTTASASINATIVTSVGISKTVDMDFGSSSVNINAGTIVLAPTGTRTKTGGVTLSNAGNCTAATFNVTGEGAYTYAITLPNNCIITNSTGTKKETMTINAFASNPTLAEGGTLTSGVQILHVGATLNVGGSQTPGIYISGNNFNVTINYN